MAPIPDKFGLSRGYPVPRKWNRAVLVTDSSERHEPYCPYISGTRPEAEVRSFQFSLDKTGLSSEAYAAGQDRCRSRDDDSSSKTLGELAEGLPSTHYTKDGRYLGCCDCHNVLAGAMLSSLLLRSGLLSMHLSISL